MTTAVIALGDVARATRFFNVLLAEGVIAAPGLLHGASTASRWSDLVAGTLVIVLSLRRGPLGERYGSWQRFIK